MNLAKTGTGTAITQTTVSLNHVDIYIPTGKGGVLKCVEVLARATLETLVEGGGSVVLRCDSADWAPFEFVTGYQTALTAGGDYMEPYRVPCEKLLPSNSHVYVDYTPFDDQSQALDVTLVWEKGAEIGPETFSKMYYTTKACEVTATTKALTGTITIPSGKGGTLYAIGSIVSTVLVTVANSGGLVEIDCDEDIYPCAFYTPESTIVGALGCGEYTRPYMLPYALPVYSDSVYSVYYTPRNANTQGLSLWLMWFKTGRGEAVVK